ncbi:MAG: HD domain-containing protein, partial [Clostridia bacterium]|nr:HD domain-containing protein [Clostridia bacterium]
MRRDELDRRLPDYATPDEAAVRRKDLPNDRPNVWRTPFIRDVDKILHCPFYNRYADKTQVFSFYRNDDLTRRSLHVQLVSRIARTIGRALRLNLDLIEAIALGHDIGHTPFGHAGEEYLDRCLYEKTGRHFAHNLQSVRVLDGIFPYNVTIQTLSGIA